VSIWSGTTGKLDELDVADIRPFETQLHEYIAHNRPQIFTNIAETGKLEPDTISALEEAVAEAKDQFKAEKQARDNAASAG
jgi:F-type H+/Na+-transporting ATPase subunit alpha